MREMLWVTKKQESNKKRAKSFYFLTIFCIVFGNSVGIAIFTQNEEAIAACKNPITLLILYGFIGMVCLSLIFVCLELMSAPGNKFNTIPHWMRNFFGRKLGSISTIFYSYIYMPAVICALSLVSWGFFFNILDVIFERDNWLNDDIKASLIVILSAISIVGLILFNAYSEKYKDRLIIFLNFLKLIPIFCIIFVAIYAFAFGQTWDGIYHSETDNNNNIFVMMFNMTGTGTDVWSLNYFILGLPMVMLSFDGFLHGISVSSDMENSKIVSYSSIIAVITIIFINIVVAALLMGCSTNANVLTLFGRILPSWGAYLIGMMFSFCILGSIIGFGSFGSSNYYTATDPSVEGGQMLATKNGWQLSYQTAARKQLYIYIVYLLISFIVSYLAYRKFIHFDPNDITNSYQTGSAVYQVAFDFIRVVVVFSFLFYTNLIFALVLNRFTKRREVHKMRGAGLAGIILTPILWFFCLYILAVDLSNIRYLFTDNNISSNREVLSESICAIFMYIELITWIGKIVLNEIILRKVMMKKIFDN